MINMLELVPTAGYEPFAGYKYTKDQAIAMGCERAGKEVLGNWYQGIKATESQINQLIDKALTYARNYYMEETVEGAAVERPADLRNYVVDSYPKPPYVTCTGGICLYGDGDYVVFKGPLKLEVLVTKWKFVPSAYGPPRYEVCGGGPTTTVTIPAGQTRKWVNHTKSDEELKTKYLNQCLGQDICFDMIYEKGVTYVW